MKTSASRAGLMEQLNDYLHQWPVKDVSIVLPETSRLTAHGTRLLLNTRGCRKLCGSPGGSSFDVLPEVPILIAPGRRLISVVDNQFEGMTITYSRDAVHFLGLELSCDVRDSGCAFYSATSPLGDAGTQQLEILTKLGMERCASARAAVSPMLQALLFLTRDRLTQQPLAGGKARRTWCAIQEFLQEYCCAPVNREVVARVFDICPSYVSRLVARQTGESFSGYLTKLRMERAAWLLQDPDLSVQRTAKLCGFNHAAYFIRVFRENFGRTPRNYRAQPA